MGGEKMEIDHNRLCEVADAVLTAVRSAGPEGTPPAQLLEQPGCPATLCECNPIEIAEAADFLFRLGFVIRC